MLCLLCYEAFCGILYRRKKRFKVYGFEKCMQDKGGGLRDTEK